MSQAAPRAEPELCFTEADFRTFEKHKQRDELFNEERRRLKGRLKATGIRPSFSDRLADFGINLPAELFAPEPFAGR